MTKTDPAARRFGPRGLTRSMVAGAVVAVTLGPFVFGGAHARALPACVTSGAVAPFGQWAGASGPVFTAGPAEIIASAIRPPAPSEIFVTNGVEVMVSRDEGCSWSTSFELPVAANQDVPLTREESRIVDVVVPQVAYPPLAYITVAQLDPTLKPHVFVSAAGDEWHRADGLEDAVGHPADLAVAPRDPAVVYLLTDTSHVTAPLPPPLGPGTGIVTQIHKSTNGGASFTTESPENRFNVPATGMEVDPHDSSEFWLYGEAGLFHSAEGSLDQVPGIPAVAEVDIAPAPPGPPRILAFESRAPFVHSSYDGGSQWFRTTSPGLMTSAASFNPAFYAAAGDQGVFLYFGTQWIDISPGDGRAIRDLEVIQPGPATLPELFGVTGGSLEWWEIPDGGLPEVPGVPGADVGNLNPRDVVSETASLRPDGRRVELHKGQTKTVRYVLDLPKKPSPIDVYFLIDVSGSMQGAINGVAAAMADIVEELTKARIDAHFGVGQYRSYRDEPAYERVRDIGPPDQELAAALESLRADGGGEETQLEALYQTAKGEGRFGPAQALLVRPGQQATFRDQALHVVLHVTDEPISTGPPHPTYEEAIGALNSVDADQIGLAIQGGDDGPRDGLQQVANGTGAEAPAGGVDCDGDGDIDLLGAAPLVCVMDPSDVDEASAMGGAIVNLLKALEDRVGVRLDVQRKAASGPDRGGGGARRALDVVDQIAPAFHPGVNLKASNRLEFEVTYKCPSLDAREVVPMDLTASTFDEVLLDSVSATVVCEIPPPSVEAPPLPVLAPLIPILAPPAAPPEPIPNPNPNPQPNPQSQAQAQGALAAQEQKQPQLAFVHAQEQRAAAMAKEVASQRAMGEDRLQMSSYSRRPEGVPPEAVLTAGVAVMALMYGFVAATRTQFQVERVRRRRF